MRTHLLTATLLILATFLSACDGSSPTEPEMPVQLNAAASSIPADGSSTVSIGVSIDPRADADKRTIKFQTSAGEFVEAAEATDKKTIAKQASPGGTASALLRSTTTPGVAVVTVAVLDKDNKVVPATTRTVDITFERASLVTLTTSTQNALADNLTTVAVEARVPTPSTGEVAFSTNLGTFSNGMNQLSVTPNAAGIARTSLKSERVGTAIVTAAYQNQVSEGEVSFTQTNSEEIIRLEPDSTDLEADKVSEVRIVARVQPGRTGTVNFTTSRGTLSSAAVTVSNDGAAVVWLKADQRIGPVRVSGEIDGFATDTNIEFVRAYPSSVLVTLDKTDVVVEAGAKVLVTSTLRRGIGDVSLGTEVQLEALKDGAVIDDVSFQGQGVSNPAGVVTATLDLAGTEIRGEVTVRSRVLRENGTVAAEDTEILRLSGAASRVP